MPNCIYSQHYYDNMSIFSSPIALDFFRTRNNLLSEKEFIEKAIYLSKTEHISLNILDGNDRMSADFITNSLLLSPESTDLFEELLAASDLLEILIPSYEKPTVTIRLGRMKK